MQAADLIRDQDLHRLADQLVPVVAEQPLGLPVDQHDVPVAVHADHRVRARIHQPAEPGPRALPLGHVPRHARHPDDRPGPVGDRRQVQRHLDRRPVLAQPAGLVLVHPLAPRDGGHHRRFPLPVPGRDEHLDVTAGDLGGGVPVQPFGARVPAGDDLVEGLADHRVVGGLDDRGQLRGALRRQPSLGHVPDRGEDQDPLLGVEGGQGDLGGESGAVVAAAGRFHPRSHQAGLRVGDVPPSVAGVDVADRVRDEHVHRQADQFVAAVAEQPLGPSVDQHDPAVGVDAHHRVRRHLKQPGEPVMFMMLHGYHPNAWSPNYLESSCHSRRTAATTAPRPLHRVRDDPEHGYVIGSPGAWPGSIQTGRA